MKFKTSIPEEIKKQKPKAFSINFKRIGLMVTQPRQVFQEIESENHKADWKSPVIVVAVIIVLASLLSVTSSSGSTASQTQTSSSGSTSYGFSNGFSSMTPGGMQGGNPMGMMGGQTQNSTNSTTDSSSSEETTTSAASSSTTLLSRVLSAVGALLGFALTWLLIGILSNLISVSFGGQGNTGLANVFAAWTCIPLGIRSFMQIMYYFTTGNTIKAVGLSGFISNTTSNIAILFEKILAQIDIYCIWQAILLFIGIGVMTKLDKKKAILITAASMVIVILLKSLLGLGLEKIASINLSSGLLNTMMR